MSIRSATRWTAAALSVAWIVTILPALPPPLGAQFPRLFGQLPDWRDRFVSGAALAGQILAGVCWSVGMLVSGAYRRPGFWSGALPLSTQVWASDTLEWGRMLGIVVAAAIPTWIFWLLLSGGAQGGGSRRLRVRKVVGATLERARANPGRYLILLAVLSLAPVATRLIDALAGRTGLSVLLIVLMEATLAIPTGMLSYSIGLSMFDVRHAAETDPSGRSRRVKRFALTSAIVGVGGFVGTLLLIVPGIVWMTTMGFAPLVVIAEDCGTRRALARSAELTSGVRKVLVALWTGMGALTGLLVAAGSRGSLLGWATAVALGPCALLVQVACYRELAARATDATPPPVAPATDPALVVASGWSLVLLCAFAIGVGRDLLHPGPSALMLPPARGSGTDTSAPLSEWCPYSFHARAKECQLAIGNAFRSHVSSTNGFGYTGAQCVRLAEAVAPREAALTRAADVLERALGRRGRLVRQRTIAGLTVDLAVLAPAAGDDSVLLALDVGEDSSDRVVNTRTRRLATAGVPEYWRIELHPSRDVLSIDSVRTWQQPDAASGQYFLVSGSSRNPDTSLKPVSFPGVAIPIDDLLAAPCGEARAKRAPHEDRPVGAALCSGLSFPLGGAPGPTIVFSDVGRDGVATRLLFTGVSTRPSTPFDPTVNGLAIQIGGPFFGETVLETLLPAGASWSRPDESSWTYRDPEGRSSGITEVAVHSAEAERLAWEIRGERGRYRASLDEMRQWGSLAVRLRAGTGSTEPCGSVFFRTAAEVGTCHGELPGTVRCVAPDRLYACSSRDPDARLRCTLQEVAHAEDVFFATHGRFFSGKCEDLLETALPPPLMCTVMGAGSVFTAVANDPRATMGCKWDSAPKAGAPPMTCS